MSGPVHYDAEQVRALLDYDGCIAAMREAMAALSADRREQPLRTIQNFGEGRMFGLMPGILPGSDDFGAKLVSVFPDRNRPGRSAHQGAVLLFDGGDGGLKCTADAAEITHIRTACATAVATRALARPDARRLAIFGCGAQARSHVRALTRIRRFERIGIWGRDAQAAREFAGSTSRECGIDVEPFEDPRALAERSDIICTVTGSASPVLLSDWVIPGTHVNLVGSSYAGPTEVDTALVARARYFVDYRRSALAAAAEFLKAKEEGLVGDDHIVAEIGEVLLGRADGRTGDAQITIYKSLGHIAQDLAAAQYILERDDGRRSASNARSLS